MTFELDLRRLIGVCRPENFRQETKKSLEPQERTVKGENVQTHHKKGKMNLGTCEALSEHANDLSH